ncbi:hypothetical protein EG68_07019 [Paragonimus skrjabini miyazakii]|uniref:Uncharacterized protein n=1 Tax=Paragonimus skrjabini miyazakii TaxID=59628 RepID=A0A8S9YRZ1_9TREM|nr:hypothetical protein EG68_07019 [Paragonimus skrjabini miyazakii]
MATEMGSTTKTDDFEPPFNLFKESCRASFAYCHRPSIKFPPPFDSDTNLPLWWRNLVLYPVIIHTDHQGIYIFNLLSDNVQDFIYNIYSCGNLEQAGGAIPCLR